MKIFIKKSFVVPMVVAALKRQSLLLFGCLLLAAPVAVQAQFSYTTNNGTVTITGYTGTNDDVAIPSTIDGLAVTSIGGFAFSGANLTNITMPNTVSSIGGQAFEYCYGLRSFTFPDSVTNIGGYAFYECGLTNVTIPKGVISIGYNPFESCSNLTSITVDPLNLAYMSEDGVLFDKNQTTLIEYPIGKIGNSYSIPNGVTDIQIQSFYSCRLTNITIPNSVTVIGNYVFSFSSLTSVTLPSSVTNISGTAFDYCTSLAAFAVDTNNPAYSSVDGVLFDRNRDSLIRYPIDKIGNSYTVPNGVTNIPESAFEGCTGLTNVTIPRSVTSIGDWSFSGTTNLTGVYFQGDAPTQGDTQYIFDSGSATIYYLPDTKGWGTNYARRPTAVWQPQIQTVDATFGVRTNQFGFNIAWADGLSVVVEASPSLRNPVWSPVATNNLAGGSFYFSDPQWTKYPTRFYRVRSQ